MGKADQVNPVINRFIVVRFLSSAGNVVPCVWACGVQVSYCVICFYSPLIRSAIAANKATATIVNMTIGFAFAKPTSLSVIGPDRGGIIGCISLSITMAEYLVTDMPSPVDGDDPYKLYGMVLYDCIKAAERLEEAVDIEIGRLEQSSRPEYVVYDPVAKAISKQSARWMWKILEKSMRLDPDV